MNNLKLVTGTVVSGVILAGALAAPAFAWHPKGLITKYVTNVTANGQMADANDAASAVATKPGDTLKYTIVVENDGAAASNGNNDMYYTTMTDTLPDGIELVSNPAQRTITEDLGVLKPGDKVTKEYLVKVTSTKDGDVILNKACFTGDSQVKDNPQSGCNPAIITVTVLPVTPPTPPEPPKKLVVTGPGNFLLPAGVISSLGYVGNLLRLKRRASKA